MGRLAWGAQAGYDDDDDDDGRGDRGDRGDSPGGRGSPQHLHPLHFFSLEVEAFVHSFVLFALDV